MTITLLAGCSSGDGFGTIIAEPGKFAVFHCKDMIARWQAMLAREKELKDLLAKASAGTGGRLIGTVSYGPEYETLQSEKRMMQRTAREKGCELEKTYQSDDSIR